MTDKLQHILEQFPEKRHTTGLLREEDPEFRALFAHHDACVEALRYWAKSKD